MTVGALEVLMVDAAVNACGRRVVAVRRLQIFVAQGEIVEYANNCSEPIVHKAGEIRPETSGTSHWWKNLGDQTVILYVGDVLHDKNDHNM